MNKPHIEKEYKMMIDKDTYETLLSELDVKTFSQTNHYFNTFSKNNAMRIRIVDYKYIFTLKAKGDGFRYEYEFEIPSFSLDYPEVKEVLKKFNINKYEYLGQMTTVRSTKEYKYGELCIDKSDYNGKTDYELEFELFDYTKDNIDEFLDLLKKFDLEYIPGKYSKFKRFLNTL